MPKEKYQRKIQASQLSLLRVRNIINRIVTASQLNLFTDIALLLIAVFAALYADFISQLALEYNFLTNNGLCGLDMELSYSINYVQTCFNTKMLELTYP